ncbi:hypothetical protein ACEQ8H_005466 [Pleosporales sp. CAS-2024a]
MAVCLSTLFLLESGADKFIDHSAIVARRTGIPETIVGLVTAGGEWEELIVIIASLARGRASLALGNIVGSAISNILGAFSLGLFARGGGDQAMKFDQSARIYSLVLLVLSTLILPVVYVPTKETTRIVVGGLLIASFGVYLVSVGWAISRGTLTAPEDSDSEDGHDSSGDESSDGEGPAPVSNAPSSSTPLLAGANRRKRHTLGYHISYLIFGFLAICLAGYVLAHAATTLIDEIGMSDVLFGLVILSIATTLPEKFVAVMSGRRGNTGVLVVNTAGSNIFLLTLCLGIVMIDTNGPFAHQSVNLVELAVLWASTLAFTATIWFGARLDRWIGCAMIAAYMAFIFMEFTVIHKV